MSWLWPGLSKLEDLRFFLTYTLERVRVTAAVQDLLLFNRFRSGVTSAARFAVAWDRRDNRLFPTRGFFLSASVDLAPPFLAPTAIFGDQVNLFYRETLEFRFYQDIWQGLIGRFRLLAGVIRGWDENNPVPVSELYYVGGVNTVRGYRLYSLSPAVPVGSTRQPDAQMRLLQVGGNKQLILNFELEFPIVEKMGIRGVVFFDMGNAFAPGRVHRSRRALSLYKALGLRLPLVQPHRPAPLRVGLPAQPPARSPSPGAYHRRARRLPVHHRQLLLTEPRGETMRTIPVLAALALAIAVPHAARAAELKIGYVNLQQAVTEVDEGKAARDSPEEGVRPEAEDARRQAERAEADEGRTSTSRWSSCPTTPSARRPWSSSARSTTCSRSTCRCRRTCRTASAR